MKRVLPNLYHFTPAQLPYAERRAAIFARVDKYNGIWVNCKYHVQLKHKHQLARDINRMVKEGDLKQIRVPSRRNIGYSKVVRV